MFDLCWSIELPRWYTSSQMEWMHMGSCGIWSWTTGLPSCLCSPTCRNLCQRQPSRPSSVTTTAEEDPTTMRQRRTPSSAGRWFLIWLKVHFIPCWSFNYYSWNKILTSHSLIDRKIITRYSDNQFIFKIIFHAKMTDFLQWRSAFSVLYHLKLNIFGFWTDKTRSHLGHVFLFSEL